MFEKQSDSNFDDIAESVAGKIVSDYMGLTIGSDHQQILTDQLHNRIARCLRSFHHREGHLEDYEGCNLLSDMRREQAERGICE